MEAPIYIAELTINHLGMVKIAKQMILAAKKIGVNYVKFKLKNVEKYYNDDSKTWRSFNFKQYRRSLELDESDFKEIDIFCKEHNIQWFCTVHDLESLHFIQQFDPPFYKVASSDSSDNNFVDKVIAVCKDKKKPLIVSIGGKSNDITEKLIQKIIGSKIQAFILHTVSIYPTPLGKSNINYIDQLRNKYESENIKIGYSGHEVGYAPSIIAVRKGAKLIERHFALTRNLKIHHIHASLTPQEFDAMIKIIEELCIEESNSKTDYYEEELRFIEKVEYE